jgi:hypothetical protein
LIEAIKKDGLSSDGKLSIELKNGIFSVNGKAVDTALAAKYAPFLKGKEKFNILINTQEIKK